MFWVNGLLDLSWWGKVGALLILTHVTIVSITVFLHRHQTHRALELHPILSHFFRFWLWLTTGMVTKEWVAVHRKHHAKCETEEDPHSPQVLGLKKVLWDGVSLYRATGHDKEVLAQYGQGTPDDWLERYVYQNNTVGIVLMLLIDVALFGLAGISIWGLQMMWSPFWAAGVINGIGHYFGYRNFECKEAARNIVPWGILIGGEELHNNHHTYASSAKMSVKPWEFDLGWAYICLFRFLGLAKVNKLPPAMAYRSTEMVDAETLKAILHHRFEVLAQYSSQVIMPVLREERRKAGEAGQKLFGRARTLLIRHEALIDENAQHKLKDLLVNNQKLKEVYEFRVRLQDLWRQNTATPRELLEALQEWCKQAEASGIAALREFSASVRALAVAA